MHGYYISVYKLQDELYLYRWRRGGETGRNNWVLVSKESLHSFLLCVFFVLFVDLYKMCVFIRVSASSVCLPSCWNPSLCVEIVSFHVFICIYPLFHHTGVSVTLCVSFFVLFLYFSSSVFNLSSIGLGVCLL